MSPTVPFWTANGFTKKDLRTLSVFEEKLHDLSSEDVI